MPLTLTAKFQIVRQKNYRGCHIEGGKLFCTSVLDSNLAFTQIINGTKFLANGYIRCNMMCSDYVLLDIESDMFNDCILSNVHLKQSRLAGVRMEDCVAIGMAWKDCYITGARFIRCNFSHSQFEQLEFHKCVFERCMFEDVDFTKVTFTKDRFKDCEFTKLPEEKLNSCKFINCIEK